ncbi:uncharacterized protein BX664DRAFT_321201 [Halteromyces radiatus]|uniref:uncharacterized protein n=1 Tax=Halteromyces radiatus TaxID=101107 RepID=UPI0022205AA3|nr:uncharacterized protein BX664DRAFT_321201 [Halteromyces radiatus]KAI8099417.1 hypothetical protein BX664DRAFT_321201 [Halteromyces radiatus]
MVLLQWWTIVGLFVLFPLLVSTLPVQQLDSNDIANSNDTNDIIFSNKDNDDILKSTQLDKKNDNDDFDLDLNRFVQLLSSHIMVEHLENAVISLSKILAAQIQDSVQLITEQYTPLYSIDQKQQQWIHTDDGNNEDVDVRLLREQLRGAVGSYVEDQLPSMWYGHSSFAALDSSALRLFMESTLLEYCPAITTEQPLEQNVMISHECFQKNAMDFSTKVDGYIKQHMQTTLMDIVQQDLPQLLHLTDNHIRAILHHFNTFLLPPHSQLQMSFLSLQDHPDWSNMNNINDILDFINDGDNSNSMAHSVHQYVILAKSNAS